MKRRWICTTPRRKEIRHEDYLNRLPAGAAGKDTHRYGAVSGLVRRVRTNFSFGFDSTPYVDKTHVMRCYEAIIMVANTYFVYCQRQDGSHYDSEVSTASLTIGTVQNILNNSPTWAGLPHC